jgi:hypothetical protein
MYSGSGGELICPIWPKAGLMKHIKIIVTFQKKELAIIMSRSQERLAVAKSFLTIYLMIAQVTMLAGRL